ncbi:MAG: hypothetical protein IMY72_13120 [Bacteroidetes bacterium]|nr:hypothetical protein [Bacteroidota bacterium]
MKKYILILFVILSLQSCKEKSVNTVYDWNDISVGHDIRLQSISMINKNVGFVGGIYNVTRSISDFYPIPGTAPEIYKDTLLYDTYENQYYYENNFKNDKKYEPHLFKTNNGGDTWQIITTPFKSGVHDIKFITEEIGYVASENEGVYKTIDGGNSWYKILGNIIYGNNKSFLDPFNTLCFIDKNNGFVYDNTWNSRIILKTTDGGNSWKFISITNDSWLSDKYPKRFNNLDKIIFSMNSNIGYIVNGSELYKTTDLGESWEKIYKDKNSDSNLDVFFISSKIGFLYKNHLKTTDGGLSWEEHLFSDYDDIMITVNQKDFYFTNKYEGKILHLDIKNATSRNFMSIEGDRTISDICFVTENIGYAIGNNGLVLKYIKN